MTLDQFNRLVENLPAGRVIDPSSVEDCPFKKSLVKSEDITNEFSLGEDHILGMKFHSTRASMRRDGAVREMRTLPFEKSKRPELTFIPTDFLDKTLYDANMKEVAKLDSEDTKSEFNESNLKDPRLWSIHALSSEVNRFSLTK